MLKEGAIAPDFALPNQAGDLVTLDALVANGPLILFFYPRDFTPICTREACLFEDAYSELAATGTTVAGISSDDRASHTKFRDKFRLSYDLLTDAGKDAIRAFGVDGPMGIGIRRATFLIDSDKRILRAVRADLRLSPHRELVREALAETIEAASRAGFRQELSDYKKRDRI